MKIRLHTQTCKAPLFESNIIGIVKIVNTDDNMIIRQQQFTYLRIR